MQQLVSTSDWYVIIKDALTVVFAVLGLLTAAGGLSTWRKQMSGSKRFDVAYNLNFAMLKLREAIKHVRNPWIPISESRKAVEFLKAEYPGKSEEEVQKDQHPAVYEMRWKRISDAYAEAESHVLAAEILWGTEIIKLTRNISRKVTELNINLKQNFGPAELRSKKAADIHDVIYDQSTEDKEDSFSAEISENIQAIRDYLKRHVGEL